MKTLELPSEERLREQTVFHYRNTIDNYSFWSPEGNLHFGYWRWGLNPFSRRQMLEEMNRLVMDSLCIESVSQGMVVDLGCGVGGTACWGARHLPQLEWKAVNVSHEQLQEARQRTSSKSIDFVCEDYHHLSQPSDSAIGAYFMESLCYSSYPDVAIAEAARILRPASRLAIVDGYLKRPLEQASLYFRYLHDAVANNWAVPRYHEIEPLWSLSAKHGMVLIECREISWRIAPTVLQSLPLSVWYAAKLAMQSRVHPLQWRQLVASASALLLGLHRRRFGYYLVVLQKR
jgi:ubiquinone/menaquinone biosynthesis C-methylase UbiE